MPKCASDPEQVKKGKVIIVCGTTFAIVLKGGVPAVAIFSVLSAPVLKCSWKDAVAVFS